ncbi:MAG: hypothetical protein EBR09_09455 [Proteobacteria bacterium]|nr:hypothetical protein [Pseudomonadota bacterium]
MKSHPSIFLSLTLFMTVAGVTSCGVDAENNVVELDTGLKKTVSSGEDGVGLVNTTGVELSTGIALHKLVRAPEHWEYYDVGATKSLLYIPQNLPVAMSAFRRAYFPDSNQDCSGTLVHQQNSSGTFDVYFLTAHHCLYAVTPLGERSKARAGKVEFERFELEPEYRAQTDTTFSKIFNGSSGIIKRRQYSPVAQKESKTFSSVDIYNSSDVIRIPYKQNVSDTEALSTSLPVCDSVEPAADKSFGQSSTGLRMMLGFDKYDSRLVTERMNGKHNLSGVATGEYRSSSTFSSINKYVFQSMMFGSGTSFYGYKTAFKAGGEQSDSGAPVLYGTQSPAFVTLQGTGYSYVGSEGSFASNWKVNSIKCVSGVISRIMTNSLLRLSDARAGRGFAVDSTKIWDIGAETITIIQDVSFNPSAWKTL